MNLINKNEFTNYLWGVPDGANMLALAAHLEAGASLLYVARDDARMAAMGDALGWMQPGAEILTFPAWDCLPYDRISPRASLIGQRVEALARLQSSSDTGRPLAVLTTVNAFLQRVPPKDYFADNALHLAPGDETGPAALADFIARLNYLRTDTVRETGEFAVRGGIFDIFPPGLEMPVRLDFFGDELETIRQFDAATQRSAQNVDALTLRPVAEYQLDDATIERFRSGYLVAFGAKANRDSLYESVSAGRMHTGMEHWMPLFHETLLPVSEYCQGLDIFLDHEADAAISARFAQITDFYDARAQSDLDDGSSPYRPLPPDRLYVTEDELVKMLGGACRMSQFAATEAASHDAGGRPGLVFSRAHAAATTAIPELAKAIEAEQAGLNRPVMITVTGAGAASRIEELLSNHLGGQVIKSIASLSELGAHGIYLTQWGIEKGFQTDGLLVISESDIFGQPLSRPQAKRARG
ncbi:MAG: transcription-repair coupling factor, partial [Alphaproteobacteria bacterium]